MSARAPYLCNGWCGCRCTINGRPRGAPHAEHSCCLLAARGAGAVACDDCVQHLGSTLWAAFHCPRFGQRRAGIVSNCDAFVPIMGPKHPMRLLP